MPAGLRSGRARLAGRGLDLRQAHAVGVGANVDITIPGIRKGDHIVSVFQLDAPNGTGTALIVANRTAQTIIQADNTIRISVATNSPANSQVLVTYLVR